MLYRIREKLPRQIMLLLVLTLGAMSFCHYTGAKPLLRLSFDMLLRGMMGGAVTAALIVALKAFCLAYQKERNRRLRMEGEPSAPQQDPFLVVGGAVFAATAEELFLRGCLFGWMLRFSPLVAFPLNFLISAVLYLDREKPLSESLLRGVEGTLYALMYYKNRSLLMIAAARLFAEIVVWIVERSPSFLIVVDTVSQEIRKVYGKLRR